MKIVKIAALAAFAVSALSLGACAQKREMTTTSGSYQSSTYAK